MPNAFQRYNRKNPVISFRLSKEDKKRLKEICAMEKRSVNNLLQSIVKLWLAKW